MSQKVLKRIQLDMPKCLDPVYVFDTISGEIIDNVYDRLFTFDSMECVPSLVEKWWKCSDTIYTLEIRKGILFHDNTICDSFAIKLSLVRMLKYSKVGKIIFKGILKNENITCDSKYLISFKLERKCTEFPKYLSMQCCSIVNPKLILKNMSKEIKCECGTGAYLIKKIDLNKNIVELYKFDKYWGDKPYFDVIRIKSEIEYNKREELFLNDYDIIATQSSRLKDLCKNSNITYKKFNAFDMILFVLNSNTIKDIKIRKALKYMFDYNEYIFNGRNNMGTRINCAIPKGMGFDDVNIDLIEYNMSKAEELLAKIDVSNLKFRILGIQGMEDADVAIKYLSKSMDKVGMHSEIKKLPFINYCNEFDKGNFDISFMSYGPDCLDPFSFLFEFYNSNGNTANISGFNCREVDDLIYKARFAEEISNRKLIYNQIIRMSEKNCNYIWLYQGQNLKVYKRYLRNVTHNALDGDYNYKKIGR